jgi:hypothetical protein
MSSPRAADLVLVGAEHFPFPGASVADPHDTEGGHAFFNVAAADESFPLVDVDTIPGAQSLKVFDRCGAARHAVRLSSVGVWSS